MTNPDERTEAIILGRFIGHYNGWNGEELNICLCNFTPLDGLGLPGGDVWFDFMIGKATAYNEDGTISLDVDFVPIIANLPRVTG
jgi:hypothetical protein